MLRLSAKSAALITALMAAIAPICILYAALLREMRNVPMLDDYPVFLGFILRFKETPHLAPKLELFLTAQHFEYKLILAEAIAAIQWAITGHVNFEVLILLGNISVLAVLWLFWLNCFTSESSLTQRVSLFLPICYLLCSLNYAEAVDLAEFGLQIGTTIFFAAASIHFLIRPGSRAFFVACLCALLSCFSNANGFLLLPVGLLALMPRRKTGRFLLWTATFSIAIATYAYSYVPAKMAAYGTHVSLFQKFTFYLSFLGAAVENMSRFPVKGAAVIVGAIGLATFAHSCRTKFYLVNPFVFYTTLWCLLTGAIVAQGRSGLGIMLSLSLRYKIFSDLLLIFFYVYGVSRYSSHALNARRKRQIYVGCLTASVLICTISDYFGYKFLVNRQQRVQQGFNQYAADPYNNVPMVSLTDQPLPPQEPEACRLILNRAIAEGIYILPPPADR